MNKKTISILSVTTLYSILFYNQHVGINFLLFTIATILFFFLQDKAAFKTRPVLLLSFAAIFSATFASIHGSNLAMWTTIVSLLVLPGAVMHRRSSLIFDFLSSLFTISVSSVYMFIDAVEARRNEKGKGFIALLKYIVPAILIIVFFFIYRAMNPLFEKFTQDIAEIVSLGWLFFTLGGFLLVYSLYKQKRISELDNWEKSWQIDIDKEKVKTPKWNESLSFILLFIALNAMLIAVNLMDINYLYIGNGLPEGIDHKQFVHKGVGMLILSIILGISILLYFFRGALNFDKNKTLIKSLAFLWVLQNVFMVFSTTIRNTMYVDAALLTYKRIGVYFWLFFAIIGLITLFIKLQRNKTIWYLARYNVAILFIVLVASSAIDWDGFISKFNIDRAYQMEEISSLDKNYLLSLSEGNIASLYQLKKLPGFEVDSVYSYQDRHLSNSNWLDTKIYDFLLDDTEGDWRSYSVRRNRVRNDIEQLHQYGFITSLELQSHYIKSLSPLYKLDKLTELNLNNDNYNSKLEFEQINHLQQLKKLYLDNNFITTIDSLKPNNNLTHLSLQTNTITNLKFLNNFPNLDSLVLSTNNLISLSSLPALQNLKTLSLDNNPLNEVSNLNKLPNLTHLSLNNIFENVGKFPNLKSLKHLSISSSPQIIKYGLNSASSFPSLNSLNASNNELNNLSSLVNYETNSSKMPQLNSLILTNNKLKNLYSIEQFHNLEYLDLSSNFLYNIAGIDKLTKLESLYLNHNTISDISFLEKLNQLQTLDLAYNSNITDFTPLVNLNQLSVLNLSGTRINNINTINKITSLKNLTLKSCRINNWDGLSYLSQLEYLSVSFLQKEDLKAFKSLSKLKHLYITNTEEEVINAFKTNLKLVEIN
jgi:Leucine-rich repeat (LRR) protein